MLEFKMEIFELKLKLKLKLFKLSCRYKHFKNIRNFIQNSNLCSFGKIQYCFWLLIK